MCVDMYPDDTRTEPVSTSLHVYWCGNVGAQSRSVTTVSTNKHQHGDSGYFTKIVTILEKAP